MTTLAGLHFLRWRWMVSFMLLTLFASGCSDPINRNNTTTTNTNITELLVRSADGGTVVVVAPNTPAGTSVTIPANVLAQDTVIRIVDSLTQPPTGAVGGVVRTEPGNAQLNGAIVISMVYDQAALPAGTDESQLRLAQLGANGQLRLLNAITVDTATNTISGQSNTLGEFVIVVPTAPGIEQAPVANAGADINANVGTTVTLDGSNSTDADGDQLTFLWQVVSAPAGSNAALSSTTAAMPTITVDLAGAYTVNLVVNDGTFNSSADSVIITTGNTAPVASAGADQVVAINNVATLDGSTSSDANGDQLTFAWTLATTPTGSNAVLTGATTARPTFTPDLEGLYIAQLIVNDSTVNSVADTVTIRTQANNSLPTANAGNNQAGNINQTITLDGTASTDPDGNNLTFRWSLINLPAGSTATVNNDTAVQANFVADAAGTFIAQLIVNDGFGDSTADTVTVVVSGNTAPAANAGADQTVAVGATATLDGSASSDANGDSLTFSWSLTTRPAGSAAALSSTTAVNPTFTADLAGDYTAQLIVNDGQVNSAPDTIMVTTANSAPVANAGADQTLASGATVQLDGTASSDADNNSLTFAWSITSRPNGSNATLSSATAQSPTFVADQDGNYLVQLIVNDGTLSSTADTALIMVGQAVNQAPTANAGLDLSVAVGGTVQLNGAASSDPEGANLSFSWVLINGPANSSAQLSASNIVNPTFVADQAGSYVAQLTVNDGTQNSGLDLVIINASVQNANQAPQVTVNVPATGTVGTAVSMSATATDPEGSNVTVNWALSSAPAGSNAVLSGASTLNASFTPNVAGAYQVTFTANDGTDTTTEVRTVTVSASQQGPIILVNPISPAFSNVVAGQPAVSNVTISNTGDQPLTLSTLAASAPFSINNLNGTTIQPNQSVNLAITANVATDGPFSGTVTINSNAANQDPVTLNASGTAGAAGNGGTISLPANLQFPNTVEGQTSQANLSISNTGSSPLTVTGISSGDAAFGLANSNGLPVTVNAGQSVDVALQFAPPAGTGDATLFTTLQVASSDQANPTSNVTVTGTSQAAVAVQINDVFVGQNLQAQHAGSLSVAQSAASQVTITSTDSAVLLSTAANSVGGNSIVLTVPANSAAIPAFFVQAAGTPGSYTLNATSSVAGSLADQITTVVTPAGFAWLDGDFNTETFGPNVDRSIVALRLDNSLNAVIEQGVRPGAPINVNVSSSVANVGGFGSAFAFAANSSRQSNTFTPAGTPGTTDLSIQQPTGFQVPANRTTAITANVTGPDISFGDQLIGRNLQNNVLVSLGAAAPQAVNVTFTVADPSIAVLSTNANTAGNASVIVNGVATTAVGEIFVQGLQVGTTTVMVSAPGYNTRVSNITVTPAGFAWFDSDASINTLDAQSTARRIRVFRLDNAQDRNPVVEQPLRGGLTVQLPIGNSQSAIATATSPATIASNQFNAVVQVTGNEVGSTVLSLSQPSAEFTAPATGVFQQNITVNVTGPGIGFNGGNALRVGQNLQQAGFAGLFAAPPAATDFTVTVANPSIAVISNSASSAGSATLTFSGVTGTNLGNIQVQGLQEGTTTMTIAGSRYQTLTATLVVDPSGFAWVETGTFNATVGQNTDRRVRIFRLESGSLNPVAEQALRPGFSATVNVASSTGSVGTFAPVNFNGGDLRQIGQFVPLSAGSTNLSLQQPATFETPADIPGAGIQTTVITANVSN